MKKTLRLFILSMLTFATYSAYAQNDPWTSVMGNGFGSTNNVTIFSLDGFSGSLYAGTMLKTGGPTPAQLWKSSTGNSGSFTQVSTGSFTPALLASDNTICTLSHTNLSPGYIYLGTVNNKSGAIIYSSTNGTTWTKLSKRGMGNSKNTEITPDIVVFNPGKGTTIDSNFIYVGERDTAKGGYASIWRTLYNDPDSTHWKKVFDFKTVSPHIQQLTWLYVWGDTLYVTTQDTATKSHLFQTSDGFTWKENAGAKNGFGVATNQHIAALAAYKNVLYATTMDPSTGAQVWKTSNGSTWTQVTGNAFGFGQGITEMRRAVVANGMLWVSGQWFNGGSATDDLVWHTTDGTTWTQSNQPGFGVSTNVAGFPTFGFYNQQVYEGTYNLSTGTQLWRSTVGVPVAGFTASATTICKGDSIKFTDTSTVTTSYTWLQNGIKVDTTLNATITFSTAGTYTIALVAHNLTLTDTVKQIITVNACTTGISNTSLKQNTIVYPNPSNGDLFINGINNSVQQVNIEITDMTGRVVLNRTLSANTPQIQLQTGLPDGLYSITLWGDKGEKLLQKQIGIVH